MYRHLYYNTLIIGVLTVMVACSGNEQSQHAGTNLPDPSVNNGGINLPKGFGATVFHEGLGKAARHIVVRENGNVYVKMQQLADDKGIFALSDTNNDGKADVTEGFGDFIGTGIDINGDYLYVSSPLELYRYKLDSNLSPSSEPELMITNFPEQNDHWSKPFTFDDAGNIYVTVGSPSNACQQIARSPQSTGIDPCPQRDLQAGIWQFRADQPGQVHGKDGIRYAAGIRNAVGLDWNFETNKLYAMQHGRDQLNQLWPELYSDEDNAQLPAEEFLEIEEGDDFGWPYCYYDQFQQKKILGPEYGGDTEKVGRCATVKSPLVAFPGHLAPNDLLFYTGEMFPEKYRSGAFVAFHGSWNRAPLTQAGYFVAFIPFENGKPKGDWEIFANGFAGKEEVVNPGDALERPMGLAQGHDGALYVTSSVTGKIWKIMYYGENSEQVKNLKIVEQLDLNSPIKSSEEESEPVAVINKEGKKVYSIYCLACHQADGRGVAGLNPPLTGTEWVSGDKKRLIGVMLNGLAGEKVDGEEYRNVMAPQSFLTDKQIADVLTYVRSSFGNDYDAITMEEVKAERL